MADIKVEESKYMKLLAKIIRILSESDVTEAERIEFLREVKLEQEIRMSMFLRKRYFDGYTLAKEKGSIEASKKFYCQYKKEGAKLAKLRADAKEPWMEVLEKEGNSE